MSFFNNGLITQWITGTGTVNKESKHYWPISFKAKSVPIVSHYSSTLYSTDTVTVASNTTTYVGILSTHTSRWLLVLVINNGLILSWFKKNNNTKNVTFPITFSQIPILISGIMWIDGLADLYLTALTVSAVSWACNVRSCNVGNCMAIGS